jgi:hypothetical protein
MIYTNYKGRHESKNIWRGEVGENNNVIRRGEGAIGNLPEVLNKQTIT